MKNSPIILIGLLVLVAIAVSSCQKENNFAVPNYNIPSKDSPTIVHCFPPQDTSLNTSDSVACTCGNLPQGINIGRLRCPDRITLYSCHPRTVGAELIIKNDVFASSGFGYCGYDKSILAVHGDTLIGLQAGTSTLTVCAAGPQYRQLVVTVIP